MKEVKCVNSTRKIVYMLSNLEPDRSVTGGAWYSDQGRGGSYSFDRGGTKGSRSNDSHTFLLKVIFKLFSLLVAFDV